MDWRRARAILLVAFAVVNLLLIDSLWGSGRSLPTLLSSASRSQAEQLRLRLADRGLVLPAEIRLPETPPPMGFLRVEYRPDLTFRLLQLAYSQGKNPDSQSIPRLDPATQAIIYRPRAQGDAAREVRLDNRGQVRQVAEDFLRSRGLLHEGAAFSGVFAQADGRMMVEFVPQYGEVPIFSGYLRVYVSERGIEEVTQFWITPLGLKEAAPKAVRPAAEALLRLAGLLEQGGDGSRTVADIQLGYYSGPLATGNVAEGINSWETVPVWRITLENGEQYYVNAFNGEFES